MTDDRALSDVLRDRREALGKSLQQIADGAGITKSHLWELERGTSANPSVGTLICVGAALGISAHTLFAAAVRGFR